MRTTRMARLGALLAAATVIIAGCGGDADTADAPADAPADTAQDPDDGDAAADAAADDAAEPDDAAAPASDVTLSVWVMGDNAAPFEAIVSDFTDATGIAVEVEAIPWDNVNDKLTTAVASGAGPDVTQIGLSLLPQFIEAGALLDLSAHLDDNPGVAPERFVDAAAGLVDGEQIYSMPWISDTRVLFTRTDILAEAGYDAPPDTWEELYDVAVDLAERGDGQYGYYIPQWDRPLPVLFTWQAGGEVVVDDRFVFDSPEFLEAAEFYTSFHASGAAPLDSDFDQTVGFITGVTPMLVSGPYLANAVADQAPELDGLWSVSLLPQNLNRTSLFAGSNLGVWHNTDHVDESLALLAYLADPATQLRWFETTGELPTVLDAVNDPALSADPLISVYMQQLQESRPLPLDPAWDAANGQLLEALNEVVLTGLDLDTALDNLNARVTQPAG